VSRRAHVTRDSARRCRRLYTVEEPRLPARSICSPDRRGFEHRSAAVIRRSPPASGTTPFGCARWRSLSFERAAPNGKPRGACSPMSTSTFRAERPSRTLAGRFAACSPRIRGRRQVGRTKPLLDSGEPPPPLGPVQLPCRAPPGAKSHEAAKREGHRHGRQRQHQECVEDGEGHVAAFGGGNRLFPKCEEGTAI
jgi:hypothetical protein